MKLTCALLLLGLSATYANTSGCGKSPIRSGKHTFTNQGRTREYWVHVPRNYNRNSATPVVTMFHGWGYSGAEWVTGGGWGAVSAAPTADANNFIIVAPTGLSDSRWGGNCDNGGGYCGWNGGGTAHSPGPEGMTCNPSNQRSNLCYRDSCTDGCNDICSWGPCNDDATMVHALLDKIESELCVDQTRVYAGGESNGAMMTWQMGTDSRAGRFAAMAATIGLPHHGYDFLPAVLPMPMMGVWGSNDRTIPPGGESTMGFTESSDGWYYTTGRQITTDWAKAHGADTSRAPLNYPTSNGGNGLSCTAFNPPNKVIANTEVVDCRFRGSHTVEKWVPDLMWEFFSKHTRELKKDQKPSEVMPHAKHLRLVETLLQ